MRLLLKTTNEKEAEELERKAQQKFGGMAVYRFQYRAIDGKFYYEILINEIWL